MQMLVQVNAINITFHPGGTVATLFPFGTGTGDTFGPTGDDSSSPPLTLTTPFTFYGRQYHQVIVRIPLHVCLLISLEID